MHGTPVSSILPSVIQLTTTQRLQVTCSATGNCSRAMRGYLSSSGCAGSNVQSALGSTRTDAVQASYLGEDRASVGLGLALEALNMDGDGDFGGV